MIRSKWATKTLINVFYEIRHYLDIQRPNGVTGENDNTFDATRGVESKYRVESFRHKGPIELMQHADGTKHDKEG